MQKTLRHGVAFCMECSWRVGQGGGGRGWGFLLHEGSGGFFLRMMLENHFGVVFSSSSSWRSHLSHRQTSLGGECSCLFQVLPVAM